MNQEIIEAEPKEAAKSHGIMAHEKQFLRGGFENCAYLWKNPGYAPDPGREKERTYSSYLADVNDRILQGCTWREEDPRRRNNFSFTLQA